MKGTCEVVEVEGHPMRLLGLSRRLNEARELCDPPQDVHLRHVPESRQVSLYKGICYKIHPWKDFRRLPEYRRAARMGILHVENRVVLGLLEHLDQVEIERRVVF